MQLLSLKLQNYRRYVGDHELIFASGDKNVTLIRAQNGAGKTGLLMALLFGLFGVVKYDQFRINDDQDIMVSRPLLKNNQSETATVTIEFKDDNKIYKIVRSVKAQNVDGIIKQQNDNIETKLFIDGIDSNYDKTYIDKFMNYLVGENIRAFYFLTVLDIWSCFKRMIMQQKKN